MHDELSDGRNAATVTGQIEPMAEDAARPSYEHDRGVAQCRMSCQGMDESGLPEPDAAFGRSLVDPGARALWNDREFRQELLDAARRTGARPPVAQRAVRATAFLRLEKRACSGRFEGGLAEMRKFLLMTCRREGLAQRASVRGLGASPRRRGDGSRNSATAMTAAAARRRGRGDGGGSGAPARAATNVDEPENLAQLSIVSIEALDRYPAGLSPERLVLRKERIAALRRIIDRHFSPKARELLARAAEGTRGGGEALDGDRSALYRAKRELRALAHAAGLDDERDLLEPHE